MIKQGNKTTDADGKTLRLGDIVTDGYFTGEIVKIWSKASFSCPCEGEGDCIGWGCELGKYADTVEFEAGRRGYSTCNTTADRVKKEGSK